MYVVCFKKVGEYARVGQPVVLRLPNLRKYMIPTLLEINKYLFYLNAFQTTMQIHRNCSTFRCESCMYCFETCCQSIEDSFTQTVRFDRTISALISVFLIIK